MPKVNVEQGTKEWLELRKKHITGTDIAVILGISPWKKEHQLWEEKVKNKQGTVSNWAMKRGSEEEPIIRAWYEKRCGKKFMPAVYISECDLGMSSLDGISIDENHLFEAKFCNKEVFQMISKKTVPQYYFTQVQWGCFCLPSVEKIHFAGKNQGEYTSAILERDDRYIESILPHIRDWFDKHIVRGIEPKNSSTVVVNKTNDIMSDTGRYIDLGEEIDALVKEREVIKKRLVLISDGKDCDFGDLRITYSKGRAVTDWKLVSEDYKVDVEKYTKYGKATPVIRRVKSE